MGKPGSAIFADASTRVFSSTVGIVIGWNQTDSARHWARGRDEARRLNRRAVGSILRRTDPGPCRLQIKGRLFESLLGIVPTVFAGGVERGRRLFDMVPGLAPSGLDVVP
jgi:hypothetical protein